jgi:MFS family permease
MSLGNAELAGAAPIARETGTIAGWRDKAAVVVMVGGAIFNVLALIVVSPLVYAITTYFAAGADNGVVFSLLGYGVKADIAAQLMITLLNIGIMFAGPLLGLLAERVGYMRLLTVALGLYAVAGSAGLYLQSPVGLLLSRLLLGLLAASISISCYSLIGLRFQGETRAKMLGYQSALVMATGLIGLFGSGIIASYGRRSPSICWRFRCSRCRCSRPSRRRRSSARRPPASSSCCRCGRSISC